MNALAGKLIPWIVGPERAVLSTEPAARAAFAKRFWSHVDKTAGCWTWRAFANKRGYGQVNCLGRPALAHRVAYALARGPIPVGLTLDHLCRNTLCVNPAHLEAVTMRENVLRGTSPSAQHAAMTHCTRGHALQAPRRSGAKRRCDACANLTRRIRVDRNRAAGLCWKCSSPAAPGRACCARHLRINAERMRRPGKVA